MARWVAVGWVIVLKEYPVLNPAKRRYMTEVIGDG